ncbi:MAG: 8-oxo-dGTP diphosphatase [Actinomycetota bacterium]|nr:8-oxo-dGTP diphosphatase [Actinomycetota bacterium]
MDIADLVFRLTTDAEQDDIVQLVVGAVVRDGDRVLLLRRPADDFMGGIHELPSGKVDPGEDLPTALVREVKEETGLDIADVTGYLGHFDYLSGSSRLSRQITFTVEVTDPTPVILTEHDEHRWHPLAEDPPVTDAVKEILSRTPGVCPVPGDGTPRHCF